MTVALSTLLAGLAHRRAGDAADPRVDRATIDSRKVGPGVVFVACRGATPSSKDGHDFLPAAVAAGASAVVVEDAAKAPPGVPVVVVDDARVAAAVLAERVDGVTGTNGKTTTTFLVAQMLEACGRPAAVLGTLGAGRPGALRDLGFTTPEAEVLSTELRRLRDDGAAYVAMEVSSHALATARVAGLRFAAAAFTNLSRDHLDFHGTMDAYFDAKARLFDGTLLAPDAARVVPAPSTSPWAARLQAPGALTWGFGDDARVRASDVDVAHGAASFTLEVDGARARVVSRLIGAYNVENLLVAAGVGVGLGFTVDEVAGALARASAPPGRLETVAGAPEQPLVVVDYAHTPDALERALVAVRSAARGRVVAVVGCGGDRDAGKRPLMGEAAGRLADMVVVTDDNPRTEDPEQILDAIVPGVERAGKRAAATLAPGAYVRCRDRREAIRAAVRAAGAGDVVLVAGKGHEPYQIVGTTKHPFSDVDEAKRALGVSS